MPAPTLLKRKRTYTEDDEDMENTTSVQNEVEATNWTGLPSPESEPSSSAKCSSCSEYSSEQDATNCTPFCENRLQQTNRSWSEFRAMSCPLTPSSERVTPLPNLSWGDSQRVWELMCHKDEMTMKQRDENMFAKHPQIMPRMRSILLEWLIEVCEVYNLHRETYHLSLDYCDRYLSTKEDIPKGQLQLIGITCLFLSAKAEEVYPPKITEFAYVTDGACTEQEILDKELVIVKALKWNLSPMTVNGWLTMYMQLCNNIRQSDKTDVSNSFVYPQFSGLSFIQTVQLVDLCTLDHGSLRFSYSVLAAAALYHMSNKELTLAVSGLLWDEIVDCVEWTTPFALVVQEESASRITSSVRQGTAANGQGNNPACSGLLKTVPHIVVDNSHNIQTHIIDLQMLEKAQARQNQMVASTTEVEDTMIGTPRIQAEIGLLTPPASHKKPEHQMSMAGTFT